jgi:predicted transcriptional regulator
MGPNFDATTLVFWQSGGHPLRLPCWSIEQTRKLNRMPDENSTTQRRHTTEIVTAYIARNQVAADQLPSLISTVHQALVQLGNPAAEPADEQTPAVSARRSVHRDYVVCMDCGWKGQMLKRHLTTTHGLSVAEYRARWNLTADHAMTAPAYSERRSGLAKKIGLGRGGRGASAETMAVPETETATASQPKRRGRPRSVAA